MGLCLGGQGIEKHKPRPKEQHHVEGEQSVVVQGDRAVHSKEEIEHQGELQDHIGGQFLGQVLVPLPTVGKAVDVELGGAHKLTAFAQMSLQYGHGIVKGKAQGHGKEGEKEFDIVHEIVKTAPLDTLVGKPITDEQDDGADDKEAGHLEDPAQVPIGVLDIEHGDAEQGHDEHTE